MLHRALILGGILLFALNLRSPIVAVAPVLDRIVADVGLGAVSAGLLTSLPVLAFALTTAVAAGLLGKIGPDFAVGVSLCGIILGVAIRSAGDTVFLFGGTVLMGFAITLGNVVVPVLIRRNYPPQGRAFVTGLYTAALNVGSMLTLVATVPVSDAIGWRLGLVSWSALAVGALLVWLLAVGWRKFTRPHAMPRAAAESAPNTAALELNRRDARSRIYRILFLSAAFGGQAFSYYSLTAWLPQILGEVSELPVAVSSAGSSLFQIFAVVGALGIPLLARKLPYGAIFLILAGTWALVPTGLLLAPQLWPLWLSFGGSAQGGTFTVVFIVVVELARNDGEAGRYSAIVQGIGYSVAATGPSILGALNEASGSWIVPIEAIFVAVVVLAAGGVIAARGMRMATHRRPLPPEAS